MRKIVSIAVLVVCCIGICCVVEAEAGTIYVPSEYATIQDAIDSAVDGDTIFVSPGEYHESIDFIGKNIVIMSTGGYEVTLIDASGIRQNAVTFQSGESNQALLSGFTITTTTGFTGKIAVHCRGSSLVLLNNRIAMSRIGVFIEDVQDPPVILQSNIIQGNYHHGVDVKNGRVVMTDNQILETEDNAGVRVVDSMTGSLIERNTLIRNLDGMVFDNSTGTILHNTIVSGERSGIAIFGDMEEADIVINGNNVASNGIAGIRSVGPIVVDMKYNNCWNHEHNFLGVGGPGETNMSVDPLFKDVGQDDYSLQESSQLIDAADPQTPVPFGGGVRADIGDAEFFKGINVLLRERG